MPMSEMTPPLTTTEQPVALVWFRQDLRLADNAAFYYACQNGFQVIPVYIWSPQDEGDWPMGAASRWWLHQSLGQLSQALKNRGSRLIIAAGDTLSVLRDLAQKTGVSHLCYNRRMEPAARAVEAKLIQQLSQLTLLPFEGALLYPPGDILNTSGEPMKVFTPFWNRLLKSVPPVEPIPLPKQISSPLQWPASLTIEQLSLLPTIPWYTGFADAWQPGESGAWNQLNHFVTTAARGYETGRDRPDQSGTSRLSPHLHFGEISPRQVWWALQQAIIHQPRYEKNLMSYLRELGWREFAHHVLYHFSHTPQAPFRPEFSAFPSVSNQDFLKAWQQGKTGYPIVDAGMRELWITGWMHNRVRMIVASFLVKHGLQPWQDGAAWFWDTLVDADLANNTMGWQWVAGCGVDAAPYFRIFNPILQGEKFDPEGQYVRQWVPELRALKNSVIHHPWTEPPLVLCQAGVILGETYPYPVVDHQTARAKALAAFEVVKHQRPELSKRDIQVKIQSL